MPKIDESAPMGTTFANGAVKVYQMSVTAIEDISGQTGLFRSDFVPEVGLQVMVQNLDKAKERKLYFFGKYRRDETNQVIGHHGYSDVVSFLRRVLGAPFDVKEDFSLLPEVLKKTIGKKFYMLEYVYELGLNEDKTRHVPYRNNWSKVSTVSPEALFEEFENSVARGYPRDYRPELMEEVKNSNTDTSFNYGENLLPDSLPKGNNDTHPI